MEGNYLKLNIRELFVMFGAYFERYNNKFQEGKMLIPQELKRHILQNI